jgi:Uma2 family endonuclease
MRRVDLSGTETAMSSSPKTHRTLTLKDFQQKRGIDDHPYKLFIDGRMAVKPSPKSSHSTLQGDLLVRLRESGASPGLGRIFPELRCTYAGRSIIPDLTFLLGEHITRDARGKMAESNLRAPDLHVEIVSPQDSLVKLRRKLLHSTSNGCPLGLLIHPDKEWIVVLRAAEEPRRLAADDAIAGEPVLPGFRLPVKEVFGWPYLPDGG